MKCEIFLLLLLGHFIADFMFQTGTIANNRCSGTKTEILKWNAIHSGIHFAVYSVLLFGRWNFKAFFIVFILSLLHLAVDLLKSFLISIRPFTKYSIANFLLDQMFHIILIYFIVYKININEFMPEILKWLSKFNSTDVLFPRKVILTLLLLVAGLWAAGIFISKIYEYITYRPYKKCIDSGMIIKLNAQKKDRLSPDISFMVGILERLLIICSIVMGLQEVIGFVLATKSIARFKEFDDKNFVINFIIGSFMSFLIAIIIGVVIRNLGVFNVLLNNNK